MQNMNILDQSHILVLQTLDDLPETQWEVPGVHGDWSVKDIVSHLTSYELLLLDALKTYSGAATSPAMRAFAEDSTRFEADEVARRKYETAQHIEDEYNDTQLQTTSLLSQLTPAQAEQGGKLTWAGQTLSLSEWITRMDAHTREHCAEIRRFREQQ